MDASIIETLHDSTWKDSVAMISFIGLLSIQALMVSIHKLKGTASVSMLMSISNY